MTHCSKHRILWLHAAVLLLLASTMPAPAQDANLLDSERWADRKYGVSFLPPLGAKLLDTTGDDALVRVLDEQARYQITVSVKRSRSVLTLEEVLETARFQIMDGNPSTRLLEKNRIEVGDLKAGQQYFAIPQPSTADALLGQTIVLVDAQTYAIVEVNAAAKHADIAKRVYNAVLQSLEVADQAELVKQRREAIDRSEKWRAALNEKQLRAAVGPAKLYRIVQDDQQDIGWMRFTRGTGEFAGQQGVQVVVETHLEIGQITVDSKADYFRPFNTLEGEVWSVRSGVTRTTPRGEQKQLVMETGTASLGTITVKIDGSGDADIDDMQFQRPDKGYLPQVDGWLLPWLLPHDTAGEYGFYWFNTNDNEMTYRVDRVTPTLNGFTIATRLSPNSAELKATYDRHGNLIEKDLGSGRKLIPTEPAKLRAIWGIR